MKIDKLFALELGIGLLICLAVSLFFVSPVLQGKELKQFDILQYEGSAKEIKDYREKGEEVLWTNSMFSGMPAYLISTMYKGNVFTHIRLFLVNSMPKPAPYIFLLMLNFFILMIAVRAEPWLAVTGALAFAFSTYFIVIIAAGHNAKVDAIAWLPGVLGAMIITYRRNLLAGAGLFGLLFALELKASHPQMTYYFAFLALAFVIGEAIGLAKEKNLMRFLKASALLGIMAVFAVGANWSYIKTTSDYAKYSIRGKSELTSGAENKTSGLDRDYITQWSNGISETMTFLIPNFKGGESGDISKNADAMSALNSKEKRMIQGGNAYWGDQPFTGGPVYVGAGIFLLFIFSLFYYQDRMKWPMLAASLFLTVVSWGHHVPSFTNFMMDHFPLYNKFRAVASALIIPELVIPLLALASVAVLVKNRESFSEKALLFGKQMNFTNGQLFLGVSGGMVLLLGLMFILPELFNSFYSTGEYDEIMAQFMQMGAAPQQGAEFLAVLEKARIGIFRADVLRSLLFVVLTAAIVWSYGKFGYHKYLFGAGLFLITAADLLSVNRRYLNENNFVNKNEAFKKTTADIEILKDTDLSYRVANLSVSTFQDATTSYYHKSIGGYHGAKLKKYQELIEQGISPELNRFISLLRKGPGADELQNTLKSIHVLNRLNTRYFILNPQGAPMRNPYALGNAWFPQDIIWVENADEEMARTVVQDPIAGAVVDKKFEAALSGVVTGPDSLSTVKLTAYHPEKLTYEVNASADRVLVFSEIWYPAGWYCSIDGTEVPIARADYVFRAVKVPSGKHTVELVFAPRFQKDENISLAFSITLLLAALGLLIKEALPYFKK
jgi:hypothetical protein